MRNALPIRKVIVGGLATGLVYAARKAGFVIGHSTAATDANVFVGWVLAYVVPDPRVQRLERPGISLLGKLRAVLALAEQAAAPQPVVTPAPAPATEPAPAPVPPAV